MKQWPPGAGAGGRESPCFMGKSLRFARWKVLKPLPQPVKYTERS